jgi:DNA-binding NarL/FixJ family response regulator
MAQQVLVIDDHPTIAELLAIHLTSGFEIDDAANSEQMHTRLQNKKYDVAVLDLELKDGHNGLEHIVKLQESGTRVLIYSGSLSPDLIRNCFAQRVFGIMDKNERIRDVAKAVIAISEGNRVIPDGIMLAVTKKENRMPRLTHNETVVLNFHFVVPMPTTAAIAANMGRSQGRIANIITALHQKLGSEDRQGLLMEAKRRGHSTLLPLPKKDPRQPQ